MGSEELHQKQSFKVEPNLERRAVLDYVHKIRRGGIVSYTYDKATGDLEISTPITMQERFALAEKRKAEQK